MNSYVDRMIPGTKLNIHVNKDVEADKSDMKLEVGQLKTKLMPTIAV